MLLLSVIFIFCLIFGVLGVFEYLSDKGFRGSLRYAIGIILPLFVSIVLSYFIAREFGLKEGLSDGLIHFGIMVVLALVFGYLIRVTYRIMSFRSVKRGDYSLSAFFRWRWQYMRRERIPDDTTRGDSFEETKMTLFVILIACIMAFLIGLVGLYTPKQKISHDFIVADSIESCTVEISSDTEFYDGLPTSQSEILFKSNSKITVRDVTVCPVTDRNNINLHYWRVDFGNLSEDDRRKIPITGWAILAEWDVVVYRKDGEIIQQ